MASSTTSLYLVLGIPTTADENEIRAAYRRLARTCHPDVVSIKKKEMSANLFMKIHAAYSTLSDPDKRADYDKGLYGRNNNPFGSSATMAAPASSGFYSYRRRGNWETDQCW
ncbi:Chaperone protein dnaJ 11 [Hibiscus syriacus]|uniref:Chaperone protein dnaJ 11 n=1 Tax=Hibiscus syriacus TaxID=106335 RepID=A0A6A3A696_HIBSY|nr:chaperone protein dnaJ 11, chloroplastic-like [Hibiscus syriacus]KAE8698725.1 Chaperone protein dnaJ 11 [Hibiscus syriacus]